MIFSEVNSGRQSGQNKEVKFVDDSLPVTPIFSKNGCYFELSLDYC